MTMTIEREENALQSLRRILSEDDKVSKAVRSSHLLNKYSSEIDEKAKN